MKNEKLIPALTALLAGLAVGAALGALFAPESGQRLRKRIYGLAGKAENDIEEEPEHNQSHQQEHTGYKKPKSDIKSLIHQAHTAEAQAEHTVNQDIRRR